jgi:hypothetical protein
MLQEKMWIMGIWKFADKISNKELGEIASEWADEDPNYLNLYIRKTSKNQMGIGFTYQIIEGKEAKEAHNEYFGRTSDYLKRKFGNDLVGWDIAAPIWIIK